jgi:galactokinase
MSRAALANEAARALARVFGRDAELAVQAPGRVNLIGEYTDLNEGLVLPLAIDRGTVAVAARRDDALLRVHSTTLDAACEIDTERLERRGAWGDYVAGVAAAFRAAGLAVPGLDVAIASDLPRESGLSSSASLEVAMATLFDVAGAHGLEGAARAALAHRAEQDFVGVPCGRMDQLASALGRADHALRIDCRDFAVRAVPLRGTVLIADSGVRRQLTGGDYARRRTECEEGFAAARVAGIAAPNARAWRDVDAGALAALERALDLVLFRRARHVVTENARVDAVCAALAAGDLAAAGASLREGMASLRDDFEVSRPELDALCAIADAVPGCFGSRLTGAGFGGCTIHLVEPARAAAVADAIRAGFADRYGREPAILVARASDGAGPIAP